MLWSALWSGAWKHRPFWMHDGFRPKFSPVLVAQNQSAEWLRLPLVANVRKGYFSPNRNEQYPVKVVVNHLLSCPERIFESMFGVWRKKVSHVRVESTRTYANRYHLKSHGKLGGINDVEANANPEATLTWARVIASPVLQIHPLHKADRLQLSTVSHDFCGTSHLSGLVGDGQASQGRDDNQPPLGLFEGCTPLWRGFLGCICLVGGFGLVLFSPTVGVVLCQLAVADAWFSLEPQHGSLVRNAAKIHRTNVAA